MAVIVQVPIDLPVRILPFNEHTVAGAADKATANFELDETVILPFLPTLMAGFTPKLMFWVPLPIKMFFVIWAEL